MAKKGESNPNAGRKSKLTAKVKQIFKEKLELGMTYKDVCAIAGVSFETFNTWRKKYPEFSDLVEGAEAKCAEVALKSVRVGQLKDWRAGAWWLERRRPDEYKERKEISTEEKPSLVEDMFSEE